MKFSRINGLKGQIQVPGDKSISHRSVMFGSIAQGTTEIHGYLQGADCLSTISCFQKMSISIENKGETVLVHGRGLHGLTRPDSVLDCGNSGTTTRLISGILSAQSFDVTLTGDASIQKRPMKRIMEPLSQMGARTAFHPGKSFARHPLYFQSSFRPGKILDSISRTLRRGRNQGHRALHFPQSQRDHAPLLWR